MAQQDYLLRIIEVVGLMLIRLRKLLVGGEIGPGEAEERIQHAADRAGLDLHFLCAVDQETLVMLMSPTGEVEPGRCWLTAELLSVDGMRCAAEDDDAGAHSRFIRALLLYRLIDPDAILARGFPEVRERIAEMEALVPEAPRGL